MELIWIKMALFLFGGMCLFISALLKVDDSFRAVRGALFYLGVSALALLFCVGVSGCASQPRPFVDGAEVAPPWGCTEARTRGVNC